MGFAAGFGEGFSKAFLQRQELDAQAERDEFQVAYTTFMDNKKKYDADKKADEEYRKTAKTITSSLPNVNPNSWTYAYEWLKAGYTPAQVEEKLTTVKFSAIPTAQPTTAPQATETAPTAPSRLPSTQPPQNPNASPSPVSDEMTGGAMGSIGPVDMNDTGPDTANVNIQTRGDFARSMDPTLSQQTPEAVAQPQPNNPLTNIGTHIKGKVDELFNPALKAENARNAANQRLMGTTGMSQEEFDAISGGYTPEAVEPTLQISQLDPIQQTVLQEYRLDKGLTPSDVARADVEMVEDLQSGDPDRMAKAARYKGMRPFIQAAMDAQDKPSGVNAETDPSSPQNIMKLIDGPVQTRMIELMGNKGYLATMAGTAKDMGDIVAKNGSLNTWGAKLISGGDTLQNNLVSVIQAAQGILDSGTIQTEDQYLSAMEDQLHAIVPGWDKAEDTARAERQLAAMTIRFVYTYSKTQLGQSGNSQSNKDVERIMMAVENSADPKEYIDNLKRIVNESAAGYNNDIAALSELYQVKTAIGLDKTGMLADNFKPIDLGEAGEWAQSETPEIDANPVPGREGNDIVNVPTASFTPGVVSSQDQIDWLKAHGKEVTMGTEYRVYENDEVAVKGIDY